MDLLNFKLSEKYKEEWRDDIQSKPKLRTYGLIKTSTCTSNYVAANLPKCYRSLLAQLQCVFLKLRLETGRYNNKNVNNRQCPMCVSNAVEDELHFVFEYPAYMHVRKNFDELNFEINVNSLRRLFSQPFTFGRFILAIWQCRSNQLNQTLN